MSTEFNYKRAWDEYYNPQFKKLMKTASVKAAYEAVRAELDNIGQHGGSTSVTGESQKVRDLLDAIDTFTLARAEKIIYGYGHYAYGNQGQEGGLYWKFADLAAYSLIRRENHSSEPRKQAEDKNRAVTDTFMDHVKGTEYDDEEVTAMYTKAVEPEFKMVRVDHVNHKPDIFCIGNAHMRLSQGMYLDPTVAPCANCGRPYSEHTSDRVMLLKILGEHVPNKEGLVTLTTKEQKKLNKIKMLLVSDEIKIDGFAWGR